MHVFKTSVVIVQKQYSLVKMDLFFQTNYQNYIFSSFQVNQLCGVGLYMMFELKTNFTVLEYALLNFWDSNVFRREVVKN